MYKKIIILSFFISFLLLLSCGHTPPIIKSNEARTPASVGLGYADRCREDFQCRSLNCNAGYCDQSTAITCRPIGLTCDSNRECCSDRCIGGRCIGGEKMCAKVEQFCFSDSQCCSGFCSRFTGLCEGTSKDCAFVSQTCNSDSNCCSGFCSREEKICLGTNKDPAQFDEYCFLNSQCASHYCNMTTFRCGN